MPLRLLERVMPWLAAKLPEPDIEEMLATVRQHKAKWLHACSVTPYCDEGLMPEASVGISCAIFSVNIGRAQRSPVQVRAAAPAADAALVELLELWAARGRGGTRTSPEPVSAPSVQSTAFMCYWRGPACCNSSQTTDHQRVTADMSCPADLVQPILSSRSIWLQPADLLAAAHAGRPETI